MESAALFARLRRVVALRFTTHAGQPATLRGRGEGRVLVSAGSPHELTFTESGTWQNAVGKSFRFHNVYRWTRLSPVAVRLEHLRRGPAHAVPLLDFDFHNASVRGWRSAAPHLCGPDSYVAKLQLDSSGVRLRWSIRGPRKHEDIASDYLFAALPS